ncbi:hypothetical protein D9615_007361 [Tricholomella constricta]|uniref:Uncharacterized protein n=1 Tax=Tricholomella constricta TaxID=117010 RepID=A0A8H5LXU9_9AGAR|nr:hypothetical protein D9615_007361 [Tricholomella constricta]
MTSTTSSGRPVTPEDIDDLINMVWDGFTPEQRTDLADSYNRSNGLHIPSLDPLPQNLAHARIQRPSSTTSSSNSPRARRPLPPTPGPSSNRPYSIGVDRQLPIAPPQRAQSLIANPHLPVPDPPPPSRYPIETSIPPWQAPSSAARDPQDDSSSLYPDDTTQPLPEYQKDPDYPAAPPYVASESRFNSEHDSLGIMGTDVSSIREIDDMDAGQTATSLEHPRGRPYGSDSSPYGGNALPSTSDLSYAESTRIMDATGDENQGTPSESPSVYGMMLPPASFPAVPDLSSSPRHLAPNAVQYSPLDGSGTPGPSNISRTPTAVLRAIMYGSHERLNLHDELDEDGLEDDDEEPDRFVNFSLLSHLAVQLRDKVPRGTHVKGSIPYPRAFTGKDIVSTIQSQISRELYLNHGGSANDRRAALQVARSLQSQLMFYEVEWGERILQDGVEDVYMFLDDEEGGSNAPREALPTSVVTILARCYSPSCGEGPECYAYGCPRKGDSLNRLLPLSMETPSDAVREAWPKTVPPEILQSLSEKEINRQIIIHKLISKEEQYIKDLDLVDSVFIQPLRRANPPVITPSDRLENFIESVFHNIIDLRECNRRLLEVLYVRQREQAPLIGGIGDILLGIVATEFRESYPAYIGNHPLAERRMRDELENNPEFRLFIEQCSRRQSVRQNASMRLDLRHFLNRPSEHLQKYPVLLQAICKATARGDPDEGFLKAAIDAVKSLQGVAQLRTFQSAMGKGTTGKWGWQDLVSPEIRRTYTSDEAKRQSLIFELVKSEMMYVKDLESIGIMYIRPLRNSEPPIIPPERLDRFIRDVFSNFAQLHARHRGLVDTLHAIQAEAHPKIKSLTAPVCDAVLNFRDSYLNYIPNYPIAAYRIDEEMEGNPSFRAFAEADAHRLSMKDFLNCPFPHLLKYVELLTAILEVTPRGHEDLKAIPLVIQDIEDLARDTEPGVASSKQKVQLWTYSANLVFRPGETMDLDLLNESRSLIYTGKLLRQPEINADASGWNELFVILFDNYLVMTKRQEEAGVMKYHVAQRPIPLELLSLIKFNDHPTQRGSGVIRNHRSATSSASASSNSGGQSENGDSPSLYPFTIHHNGRFGGPIIMYAELSATRAEWRQKLEEAIGLRRVVQESNKVFEVETLSSHTFNVPPVGHGLTPYDSSPITGKVTCSIPFNTPDGRRLVAIGCSEGIWIGFRHDSNSMRRVLHLKSVTQCTMLDDFGLFLVLSDKQLFAYHIEALVPTPQHTSNASQTPQKLSGKREVHFFSVGKLLERTFVIFMRKRGSDSHFHVLEPVLEKIHERPEVPTLRFGVFRSPKQEWFRNYKEFFLSTDTYDLYFLKARLAILSTKGFEIMDLNNTSSTPIPVEDARLAPLVQRYGNSQFGIYVNKQGFPSRDACTIEWEGTADSVAFHPPYVLLFDPRFIEIRHVETGRLSQIIPGQDVRCVWDGRPHNWNSAATPGASSEDEMIQEAHVHAVMNNLDAAVQSVGRPLRPVTQHVFELIPTIPLYLPGSLSSPSTTSYFLHSDSYSPPRSPQLRPSTSYMS